MLDSKYFQIPMSRISELADKKESGEMTGHEWHTLPYKDKMDVNHEMARRRVLRSHGYMEPIVKSNSVARRPSTTSSTRKSNEVRRSIDSARRAGVSENRIMHSVSELDAWILGK